MFRADDYFISHLAQCDGTKGACPDERLGGQNDVTVCKYSKSLPFIEIQTKRFQFTVTADRKNGVTNVKYKRPLQTNDSNLDRPIEAGNDISVIAAIGPLNSKGEANAHSHDGLGINYEDMKIDFASRVSTAFILYSISDVHSICFSHFSNRPTTIVPHRCIVFAMQMLHHHGNQGS